MKHLEDESIANLIEGNVSKKERLQYLEHISECNDCFEVYTESMKDLEELKLETKKSFFSVLIGSRKLALRMAATLFICVITITIYLIYNSNRIDFLAKNKFAMLVEENIKEIDIPGFRLRGISSEINSVVKIGFLITDLKIIDIKKKDLRNKLFKYLEEEIKNIDDTLVAKITIDDIASSDLKLINIFKKKELLDPYNFGKFIENSLFLTFKDKKPGKSEIDNSIEISKMFKFLKNIESYLKNIIVSSDINLVRENLIKIKTLF